MLGIKVVMRQIFRCIGCVPVWLLKKPAFVDWNILKYIFSIRFISFSSSFAIFADICGYITSFVCEICMISERLRIRHWMTAQHTSIHLWGSFPHSSWEFGRFTRKIAQTRRNEKLQSWKEQVDLFAPSTCRFAAMARTLCCLGFEAGALWMSNS